jgi:transcriptional regulator with XRE-family HTH domain
VVGSLAGLATMRSEALGGGCAMDGDDLGTRIAYWRERRGMTQQLLADRLGRSKSWIEKVEAGTRNANRLPILLSICRELRLDLPVLIGHDLQRNTRECIDEVQVESIQTALERYDGIQNEIPSEYEPDIPRLSRQLSYVWSAFEMADYQIVGSNLPALLVDAQRSKVMADTEETGRVLTEVYQITASTLRKLGEYNMAWLAGDRGIALAEQIGDPILSALTAFRIANALVALGRSTPAFDLNISHVTRLEPNLRGHEEMSVYGNAVLQAAMAAASAGNAIGVRDLVREARDVARRVPDQANHHRLSFGITNVGIHHVSALVSLGEGGLAVEVAADIDETGIRAIRRERRANHYVDVARGYSQYGQRDEALEKLLQAEALAPREVNCRPVARATIENLIERSRGKPTLALRSLAERAGVTA